MIISNRNVIHPDIEFAGTTLSNVNSHRHLGVILTNRLTWSDHISHILESSSKMLHVTRKLQYQLDRESLDVIYRAFIRPKLEYASQIWDNCNDGDSIKLENFQLAAARIVTGAKKGTSHNLLYEETNWETLKSRRQNTKIIHPVNENASFLLRMKHEFS